MSAPAGREAQWAPPAKRASRGRLSAWSLSVSMFALVLSWFTAWALPLAGIGLVLALIALLMRRAQRELAWWGFGLALGAAVCGAFWVFVI